MPRMRPTVRRRAAPLPVVVLAVLVTACSGTGPARRATPRTPAVRPTTTTTAPGTITADWVRRENALPGTSDWEISGNQPQGAIEGYAGVTSATQGQSVTLYVSTAAPSFHVEAYRIGWYGGHGGRLVWTSPSAAGRVQARPGPTPGTNMVECRWGASISVPVGGDWPPGDYILKLVGSGGQQSWVPLTVRDDASRAAYAVVNAVTTWQAYNLWGGYDLYQGVRPGGGSDYADRARVVSFDRPYAFGSGAADFYGNEYPFVRLVERMGLDVTYLTDVDLHQRPGLLLGHRAVVSLGHDEYWSSAMRNGALAARDAGVNLMFLGANAVYRHIRFRASPLGPDREEICYKVAAEDPLLKTDPAEVTSNWPDPPVPRPESELIGDMYRCNPVKADMVIVEPESWIAAGTGLAGGGRIPGLVGSEYDRYVPGSPAPTNVEIVAHSPLTCRGAADASDVTYYTAPSGAGVFASGTNLWVAALGGACAGPCEVPAVTTMTGNVLRRFGAGPAGRSAPSVPNWRQFYPAPPGGGTSTSTAGGVPAPQEGTS